MRPPLRAELRRPWLEGAWDAYVEGHPEGWFWHTCGWLDYQLAYSPGSEDRSFAVLDESHRIVALAPLVLCRRPGGPELSYAGHPGPLPLTQESAAADAVVAEILRTAATTGARVLRVSGSPFSPGSGWFTALVAPYARTVAHRVVDLGAVPPWAGVRRSYRSIIHAGEARAISTEQGAGARYADYQALHRRMHFRDGSPARADATYRMQAGWLRDGRAALTVAEADGITWGAAYWYVYKGVAYYGSGAYGAPNVAHAVIWHGLTGLRALGVRRADLGWRGVAQTDKESNVEFFRAGFGGSDVPVLVADVGVGDGA